MVSIEVRGAEQLAALSKRLKEAGAKDLQKELNKAIRDAVNPLKDEIKESALAKLPQRGGLAQRVANSPTRINRRDSGVRLVTTSKDAIRRIDQGVVRHPVFGNKQHWIDQIITPSFWTEPTEAAKPRVQAEVIEAIDRVARKVEG